MTRSWITYAGLGSIALALLSIDTTLAQEDAEELLYSLDVGTQGTVLAVPGKAAKDIRSFNPKDHEFRTTTLPLPKDLAEALNTHGDGPEGRLVKLVAVIRGSVVVWDCDWGAGGFDCKEVLH